MQCEFGTRQPATRHMHTKSPHIAHQDVIPCHFQYENYCTFACCVQGGSAKGVSSHRGHTHLSKRVIPQEVRHLFFSLLCVQSVR